MKYLFCFELAKNVKRCSHDKGALVLCITLPLSSLPSLTLLSLYLDNPVPPWDLFGDTQRATAIYIYERARADFDFDDLCVLVI